MRKIALAKAMFLFLLVSAALVHAQSDCAKTGGCNSQFSDLLDFSSGACLDESTHRYQLWTFAANSGTRLIIDIAAPTFTPALDLIDPTNHVYATGSNRIDIATNTAGNWTLRVRNTVVGAGGPYTLTFQCLGGTPTPPPPPPETPTAFQIAVAPTQITLKPGTQTTVKVYVTPIADFASQIRIESSGNPNGVTLTPAMFVIPSPGLAVQAMVVSASDGAQGGAYPVTFTGTATDGTVRRGGVRLVVDAPCQLPMLIGNLSTITIYSGTAATLQISPGGTPPFIYTWYRGFSGST